MRILLVSNQGSNKKGVGNPIMYRMKEALKHDDRIDEVYFEPIKNTLKSFLHVRVLARHYDIVHIHFGGLYALLIWFLLLGIKTRKYITFHGTDIHAKALKTAKTKKEKLKILINQKSSFISIRIFDRCGFVAEDLKKYVPKNLSRHLEEKSFIQRLGVDYSLFAPIIKEDAQRHLNLPVGKYILFSDVSNTTIKRRDIAEKIVKELGGEYKLLIMSGVVPDEVPFYINACDFALLTSDEEGSPNIIRETLALNKPFFSVDVGDAASQLRGLINSSVINRNPKMASKEIKEIMSNPYVDNTRETKRSILDFMAVTEDLVDLYEKDILATKK